MSNTRYYERRALNLCPDCGVSVPCGVYCADDRAKRRARVAVDRQNDRVGYNQYMRVYNEQKRETESV